MGSQLPYASLPSDIKKMLQGDLPPVDANRDIDDQVLRGHNPRMDYVPRPELDAKLEAMEARMDTRVARIEGKLDLMMDRLQATQQGVSALRWWLLGAALSVLLACGATAIGIQQMTVTTFQAAAQQPSNPPVVIQVPAQPATK